MTLYKQTAKQGPLSPGGLNSTLLHPDVSFDEPLFETFDCLDGSEFTAADSLTLLDCEDGDGFSLSDASTHLAEVDHESGAETDAASLVDGSSLFGSGSLQPDEPPMISADLLQDPAWRDILLTAALGLPLFPFDDSPQLSAVTTDTDSSPPLQPLPVANAPKRRRSSVPRTRKATQSCDLCILRKRRCDGFPSDSPHGFKECSYCASHSAECAFTREVRKRGPKPKEEAKSRARAKSFSAVHEARKTRESEQLEHARTFSDTRSYPPMSLAELLIQSGILPLAPFSASTQPEPEPHFYSSYHASPPRLNSPLCEWDPETGFYDAEDVEAMKIAAGGTCEEDRTEGRFGWLSVPWMS